jgi:hypothetical protein
MIAKNLDRQICPSGYPLHRPSRKQLGPGHHYGLRPRAIPDRNEPGQKSDPASPLCRNAFNFHDSSGGYVVTAKHCFKAEQEVDNETTDRTIYAHQPLQVSTDSAAGPHSPAHEDQILNISALATCR